MKKIFLLLMIFSSQFLYSIEFRTEPWLTEKSIQFLENFLQNHPNAKILEFGSGASTIWFAKRTSNLTSIEHSKTYFYQVREIIQNTPECNRVDYRNIKRPYYFVCNILPKEAFDLILVDGRERVQCITHSIKLLKPGGVMMLDNAERRRYWKSFELMSNWKTTITKQPKPDKFGFTYKNWTTQWWIKPKS